MRTALDTNILSGLFVSDPRASAIRNHIARRQNEGALIISPVVYAELLARPGIDLPFLTRFIEKTRIHIDHPLDLQVWTVAGQRFGLHAARRRATVREGPRRILADFVIGAHAMHHADRLLTLDLSIYRRDFPELILDTVVFKA